MSVFLKSFLRDRGDPDVRQLFLAGFGKHPGWDDHMEDLGLETESLVLAKKNLYTQGIGGQLDAGAWEKLPEEARLPGFNHTFAWLRGAQTIVGRMWTSSDGKRRTRYPMVVCAQVNGGSAADAIAQLVPVIESLEAACKATRSASQVRGGFDQTREVLRSRWNAPSSKGAPPHIGSVDQLASLISVIRRDMPRILAGRYRESRATSHHLRLPLIGGGAIRSLVGWSQLLSLVLDSEAPQLLAIATGQLWCDLIVGEPASTDLFCLRATPQAVPIIEGKPATDELHASQVVVERFLHPADDSVLERPWLARLFGHRP